MSMDKGLVLEAYDKLYSTVEVLSIALKNQYIGCVQPDLDVGY